MVFCHNDIQTCKIQNEYTNGQIAYTFYPLKEESQVQSSLQYPLRQIVDRIPY